MPRAAAASRSMWSVPVVGEPMSREVRPGGEHLVVDLVTEAHHEHRRVADGVEQAGAVEGALDHRTDRGEGRPRVGRVVERLGEDHAGRVPIWAQRGTSTRSAGFEDVARLTAPRSVRPTIAARSEAGIPVAGFLAVRCSSVSTVPAGRAGC